MAQVEVGIVSYTVSADYSADVDADFDAEAVDETREVDRPALLKRIDLDQILADNGN